MLTDREDLWPCWAGVKIVKRITRMVRMALTDFRPAFGMLMLKIVMTKRLTDNLVASMLDVVQREGWGTRGHGGG